MDNQILVPAGISGMIKIRHGKRKYVEEKHVSPVVSLTAGLRKGLYHGTASYCTGL